jgi:hypothetical protein
LSTFSITKLMRSLQQMQFNQDLIWHQFHLTLKFLLLSGCINSQTCFMKFQNFQQRHISLWDLPSWLPMSNMSWQQERKDRIDTSIF